LNESTDDSGHSRKSEVTELNLCGKSKSAKCEKCKIDIVMRGDATPSVVGFHYFLHWWWWYR